MSRFSCLVFTALMLATSTAGAQWLKLTTPGIPRTKDGKPDLAAPAPRMAGKPDLTGLWRFNSDPYTTNVIVDLEPEEVDPSAVAIYKQRMEDLGKDDPSTYRCLPAGALDFVTFVSEYKKTVTAKGPSVRWRINAHVNRSARG